MTNAEITALQHAMERNGVASYAVKGCGDALFLLSDTIWTYGVTDATRPGLEVALEALLPFEGPPAALVLAALDPANELKDA